MQTGRTADRIRVPWIMNPSSEDACGVSRSRHSHARAHVLKIARVFEQDYRTRRGVVKQLSHVDLGALSDSHNPGSRRVGSQDRKHFNRDHLKLGGEMSVHLGGENRGQLIQFGSVRPDEGIQGRSEAQRVFDRMESLQYGEIGATPGGLKRLDDPRMWDVSRHNDIYALE